MKSEKMIALESVMSHITLVAVIAFWAIGALALVTIDAQANAKTNPVERICENNEVK
jgi:hypothetical protein